ncbi:MAG: VWA domain-containing protein, partial [Candidatus Methanomethylophilaceae archaeon]|nr:VWA domain-containing protein [Candidatus Methanomethylophilaceae archaeon]
SKGKVVIEREGLSVEYPAKVKLMATVSSARDRLDPHLKDRFDICVRMKRPEDEEYTESVRNNLRLGDGDVSFLERFDKEDSDILALVMKARSILPEVKLLKRHRKAIAEICEKYGVPGIRGLMSCAQCTVALAALRGGKRTNDDDLVLASEFTLNHRRTIFETEKKEAEPQPLAYPNRDMALFIHDERKGNVETKIVDLINSDTDPEQITELDETKGEPSEDADTEIVAKVAARFETIDLMESADYFGNENEGIRYRYVESPTGKYTGFRIPKETCTDIAVDATIRAAAPYQKVRGRGDGPVKIAKSDIREKVRTRHVEHAFYFMLDASGSLIIRNRIGKTKAAILSMLESHYAKRDRVGLMTFNEKRIEEIMAPTRAVDQLTQIVEDIKLDKGTPLSEAFMACWRFVQSYRKKHPEAFIHIVLFTDGKSTKAIDPDKDPCEEAVEIAEHLKTENVDWIVVDTGLGASKSDMPERLAKTLHGRLFMLDDLESKTTVSRLWGNTRPREDAHLFNVGKMMWEIKKDRGIL